MDACIAFRNPAPVPQPQHALGLYRSTDAGRTWGASLFPGYVVSDTGPASELACTMHVPVVAFDRQGRLFVAASCPAVRVPIGTALFVGATILVLLWGTWRARRLWRDEIDVFQGQRPLSELRSLPTATVGALVSVLVIFGQAMLGTDPSLDAGAS